MTAGLQVTARTYNLDATTLEPGQCRAPQGFATSMDIGRRVSVAAAGHVSGGEEHVVSMVGMGPIDAAYKAVDAVIGVAATLVDYSVAAVTAGIDSVATTRVRVAWQLCEC